MSTDDRNAPNLSNSNHRPHYALVDDVRDAIRGYGVVPFAEEEGRQQARDARIPHRGDEQVFPQILDKIWLRLKHRIDQELELGALGGQTVTSPCTHGLR